MNVEIFGEAPLSLKLSEVRRGLEEDFVHIAGELHTPQEYNTRAGGYSVSRSRLLVAPKNGTAETLGEIGLFADAAFQISQEKLRGGFNPKNLELALVTESVPFDVFRSGIGALREYAVGISEGLRDYRNGING